MQIMRARFIEHNKYNSLVFNYPGCSNTIVKEKLAISMLLYWPIALGQQRAQQIGGLNYWNGFKIQGLSKCVLSRILKIYGLKKISKGMQPKK